MNPKNSINPEGNLNISAEDALKQMQIETETSSSNTYNTTEEKTDPVSAQAAPQTTQKLSFEEYSKMSIKVFEQVSDLMGDFFDSLKPINSSFSKYADVFFNNSRDIAKKTKQRQLTEQEFYELSANFLVGIAVKGVGSVWSAIKTQQTLGQVKSILRTEAQSKNEALSTILINIDTVIDNACEQYDLSSSCSNLDYKDLHEKFNNLRLSLYTKNLALFLDATYKAALNNSFQNEYPYPTLFEVNQKCLDILLNLDEKHSTDEAKISYYRSAIEQAINNLIISIKEGKNPTSAEALLGMDKGLMGVAIYDCNPNDTIGLSEDGDPIGVDSDSLDPACTSTYRIFALLYEKAIDYASTSTLASFVNKNPTLKEVYQHLLQFHYVPKDYRKRMFIINLNVILSGALAFMLAMSNDLKWYWSLLIAFFAMILMSLVSPAKSTMRRFLKKLNYIERTIRITALKDAGYTDKIDLHAIQYQARMNWMLPLICTIIGFGGGPIGALIGFVIGYIISKFLSDKDNNTEEYDYTMVSTGSSWKGYVITILLVISIILTALIWINDSADSNTTTSNNLEYTDEPVEVEVIEAVEEVAVEAEDRSEFNEEDKLGNEVSASELSPLEKEVATSLYSIYYGDVNAVVHFEDIIPAYSSHIKEKFKEYDITQGYEPYTKSFLKVLEDVRKAEEVSSSLILDCDLLIESQEDAGNFDLRIEDIRLIDNNNAEVKATMFNGVNRKRIYVMKREDGVFKIDDFIDDGESTRKFLNEEIQRAIAYVNSQTTSND